MGRRGKGQRGGHHKEARRGHIFHSQDHGEVQGHPHRGLLLRRQGFARFHAAHHGRRGRRAPDVHQHRPRTRRDRPLRPRLRREAQREAGGAGASQGRLLRKPGLLRPARQGLPLVLQDQQARPHRGRDHQELSERGAVVHRPEEVRVRGPPRAAQGVAEPLDPRADRIPPHPELVRHARVAVHLLQEGTFQLLVRPRPGPHRMPHVPRLGHGRPGHHPSGQFPVLPLGPIPQRLQLQDRSSRGVEEVRPLEVEERP